MVRDLKLEVLNADLFQTSGTTDTHFTRSGASPPSHRTTAPACNALSKNFTGLTIEAELCSAMSNERLAEFVQDTFVKIQSALPYIIELRRRFSELPRGKANILGCQTWAEFCEQRLHRTDRAVRKAIAAEKVKVPASTPAPRPLETLRQRLSVLLPAEGDGQEHTLLQLVESAFENLDADDELLAHVIWQLEQISENFRLYAVRLKSNIKFAEVA